MKAPAEIRDAVALRFGLSAQLLAARRRRGAHDTRLLADARAAACWAIAKRCPHLSPKEIGDVVGLDRSSVRQAIERAPKRFKAEELEGFAEAKA